MMRSVKTIERSGDGGRTWTIVAADRSLSGTPPSPVPSPDGNVFAVPSVTTMWMATVNSLYGSRDGGKRWFWVHGPSFDGNGAFASFSFVSAKDGWLLTPGSGLWRTTDGRTWHSYSRLYAKHARPGFMGSMARVRLRVLVPVVLAVTLAACSSAQMVPPTTQNGISPTTHPASTTSTGATTTTTEARVVTAASACNASQLTVGGFGITGVSFTGVITIRIENTSSSPCSLRGYPVVTFLGNARSRFSPASYPAHLLRVTEGHTRFFGVMTRVVLASR